MLFRSLPESVIERAVAYLDLEEERPQSTFKIEVKKTKPDGRIQKFDDLVARISGVDLNSMTPIEGMLFLNSLKDRYKA